MNAKDENIINEMTKKEWNKKKTEAKKKNETVAVSDVIVFYLKKKNSLFCLHFSFVSHPSLFSCDF